MGANKDTDASKAASTSEKIETMTTESLSKLISSTARESVETFFKPLSRVFK